MFKAKSNGINIIFPKLSTTIGASLKRWKMNQQMVLLKLQSGAAFNQFIGNLKDDDDNARLLLSTHINQTTTTATPLTFKNTNQAAAEGGSKFASQQLPRPHVAPFSAQTQHRVVTASPRSSCNYDYWSICDKDRIVCRGYTKDRFKVY